MCFFEQHTHTPTGVAEGTLFGLLLKGNPSLPHQVVDSAACFSVKG